MAGGGREGWHPRQGAVAVTWFLHDQDGLAYAAMQRLEDDAGGPPGFEVRSADGRKLGVHPTGDAAVEAAWADHLRRRDETRELDDEEPDEPY